jgi:acyl dehydratase
VSISLDELREQVGGIRQPSNWITITQGMIDTFAAATFDHKFIHVDPVRAAETPFGGTVAHGFLTLSLLSRMAGEALPKLRRHLPLINYGFERVRFIEPVRPGDCVRALFKLLDVSEHAPGQWLLRHIVTVEIKDNERPALTAEWLTLSLMAAQDGQKRKTA